MLIMPNYRAIRAVAASAPVASFLYKGRANADYQDTGRATVAATGENIRSATDTSSAARHAVRATGAVPVKQSGGGLLFSTATGKSLVVPLVIAQPFVVLARLPTPAFDDAEILCDSVAPDNCFVRYYGSNLYCKAGGSDGIISWGGYTSTPRIVGCLFNGTGSIIYVDGTTATFNAGTNGFSNGIRIGAYLNASTGLTLSTYITDVGVWPGVHTAAGIAALAATLAA